MKERICSQKDLPQEGSHKVYPTQNNFGVIVFNRKGNYTVLENVCPHQGARLDEGDCDDQTITCPWHGWVFDVQDGSSLNVPGENVTTYTLSIEKGHCFINKAN